MHEQVPQVAVNIVDHAIPCPVPNSQAILLQVERAKKCLDFAATLYCIHLLAVSLVSGFPWNMSW